jgi:hypothetical protein
LIILLDLERNVGVLARRVIRVREHVDNVPVVADCGIKVVALCDCRDSILQGDQPTAIPGIGSVVAKTGSLTPSSFTYIWMISSSSRGKDVSTSKVNRSLRRYVGGDDQGPID